MKYLIFNIKGQFLAEFETYWKAQEEAMQYIGRSGFFAYVKPANALDKAEAGSYGEYLDALEA